jgi:hypothetical protein
MCGCRQARHHQEDRPPGRVLWRSRHTRFSSV